MSEEAAVGVGIRRPASGGDVDSHEGEVRESWFGENKGRHLKPQRAWGVGAESRASPPLLSCEERIELLNRAELRGYFRSRWTLPRHVDRADKHQIFQRDEEMRISKLS
jgi:hypothetical protein